MELTEHKGFVWPAHDRECRAVVFDTVVDMEHALKLTDRRQYAVQAGGNCGVWAAWLAKRFDTVYTFEPDATNYHCLRQNVPKNVVSWNVALGDHATTVGMHREARNIGAHYIEPAGDIQVRRLDSFDLPGCDYLCLDIEGYELIALRGAVDLIKKYRPVIQIEDKGLSEKYGVEKGEAEVWLAQFGYEVKARIHRDVILA